MLNSFKDNRRTLIAESKNEISAELINDKWLLVRKAEAAHDREPANDRIGAIYLSSFDGQEQKRIVTGTAPSYLKNKNVLVFITAVNPSFVFMRELGKRKNTQLTFLPKDVARKIGPEYMYEGDNWPDLSLDSNYLVYGSTWYHQGGKGFDLFIKDLKTETTRKLATLVSSPGKFSNKGSRICYLDRDSNAVIITAQGRQLHKYQTKRLDEDERKKDFWNIDWSQDDKQLILWSSKTIAQLSVDSGAIKNLVTLRNPNQRIDSVAPFDD